MRLDVADQAVSAVSGRLGHHDHLGAALRPREGLRLRWHLEDLVAGLGERRLQGLDRRARLGYQEHCAHGSAFR